MSAHSSSKYALLDQLAEEFAARVRRGERPSLQEYIEKHPELADDIREILPAMVKMEQVKEDRRESAAPTAPPAVGGPLPREQVGDYRIIREVGQGGMGVVYEAEQISLGRRVALKVLPLHASLDGKALERFKREARSAARLHHTNIVPVFEVGQDGEVCYYAMQLIRGQGLDQVVEELRRLRQDSGENGEHQALKAGAPRSEARGLAYSLVTGQFLPKQLEDSPPPSQSARRMILTDPHVPANLQDNSAPGAAGGSVSACEEASVQHPVATAELQSPCSVILPGRMELSSVHSSRGHYFRSVAGIGQQVATALAYAHARGIIHRDIKPSNLLLDAAGIVWVTDFGLAKTEEGAITEKGDIVGTLRYMAPERFRGECDARADIYGLGLTLYELLVLQPAFDARDRVRLLELVMKQEPARPRALDPRIPRDMETIVLKAIDKDPSRRYASAEAMAEDLRRFASDEPIQARRASSIERLARWSRRNPALAVATGLAAAALLCVAGLSVVFALAQDRYNRDLLQEQAETLQQKERAETALRESRQQSALMAVERGQSFIEQQHFRRGLLWLARGLGLLPDDDADLERAIRANLAVLPRETYTLRRVIPTGASEGASLSPDARTLATSHRQPGGRTTVVRCWDTSTGRGLGRPLPHPDYVYQIAFSPEGQMVATACSDASVRLWEVASGRLVHQLQHKEPVYCVAYSPDGENVVTGGGNMDTFRGEVRIWDPASGKLIASRPQPGLVLRSAISPDGKMMLLSLMKSRLVGVVQLQEVTTGKTTTAPLVSGGVQYAADFSPDGRLVLTGGPDRSARLWETATGREIRRFSHDGTVNDVAFSPDGSMLLISGEGMIRFHAKDTDQPIGEPLYQRSIVCEARFSPDGQTLLVFSVGSQGTQVWEAPRGRLLCPPLPHPGLVSALALSPDGKTLLTGCYEAGRGEVQQWDLTTGKPIGPALPHHMVSLVAFGQDGKTIRTVGTDAGGTVLTLWDRATGKLLGQPVRSNQAVTCFALSSDGRFLVIGSSDRTARVWDVETDVPLSPLLRHQERLTDVEFSPEGKVFLTVSGTEPHAGTSGIKGEVRLWETVTGRPLLDRTFPQDGSGLAAAVSPGGRLVLTATGDRSCQLWEAATGKPIGSPLVHAGAIQMALFSSSGDVVLTAGADKAVRLWDTHTGLAMGPPLTHPEHVSAAAFAPDGRSVLTGCGDRMVRVWDIPRPLPVPSKTVLAWAEQTSGQTLSPEGAVGVLDEPGWKGRQGAESPLGQGPGEDGPAEAAFPGHDRQALRHLESGNQGAARWHLDRQLRVSPNDWLARILRTRLDVPQGQLDQAATDIAQALKAGPAEKVGRWLRTYGVERAAKGETPAAQWYLGHAVASGGSDWIVEAALGDLHAKARRWPEATAAYGKAVNANPASEPIWEAKGRAHIELSQWQEAAEAFARALDLLPPGVLQGSPRGRLCETLLPQERVFERLLELQPKAGELWVTRARDRARRSQWALAAADYMRGIESRPASDDWLECACVRLILDDADGYNRLCYQLIERAGPDPEPAVAYVLARTCALGPAAGVDPARAVEWGEKASVGLSKTPWVLHALGLARFRAGQDEQALALLTESDGYRWDGAFLDWLELALIKHHQGHKEEAQRWFMKAVERLDQARPATGSPVSFVAIDWLEAQVLRRQVEALLGKVVPATKK
jgi:WD40 repeat protein/serine/threonine protein kinase/tetratricopeptide (TPR) repeat protein